MKRFFTAIVDHPKTVLTVFAIVFLMCVFSSKLVKVNYDINDYLPADTHSTVSLDKMNEEFSGGIPNARVMVQDVTIPQALEYKEQLKNVDGITAVMWLDDSIDITVPLTQHDEGSVETYYKDSAALFSVTIAEDKRIAAVEEIRSIIGEDNAMTGTAVSIVAATDSTVKEIPMIAAIAVVFALIVLLLTTHAWLDPLLVLGGLGVAIMLNNGTNLLFGEISFITNASGSILQLAVSLDYSVFLLHRFEECRKTAPDAKTAMVDALCKSTSSILSSGLTTVIGFLALALMRFLIGPDLGFALAKGVGISLLTVFLFMPALILTTHTLVQKTAHKPLMPSFNGFAKTIMRVTMPLVCVFAIILVPVYMASNANEYFYGSSRIFTEDSTYGADTAKIESVFGKSDTYVLLVPRGDSATERALSDDLQELDNVTSVISYVDMAGAQIPTSYLDADTLALLMSDNYSRMLVSVSVPYEGDDTFSLVKQVRDTAEAHYGDDYYLAGQGVSTYDLMDTITADMLFVNLVAIGAVFLVLVLTMRSLKLPIILVLCIETAIWLNLAIPYFAGETIFYIAYLIISAIQLGATVDYAILMADRYRENRKTIDSKKAAAIKTVSDVSVSILTSGSVLTVVGFLMGAICSNKLLAQLGIFIGRGAVFSLIMVFLVLPGLLCLFDSKRKRNTTLKGGDQA